MKILNYLIVTSLFLFSIGCKQTTYFSNAVPVTDYATYALSLPSETIVVDNDGNDVTSIFSSWYGKSKNQDQIFRYLAENKYSFKTTHESNDLPVTRIFSTKRITQIFVDSFTFDINNQSVERLFVSSISVSIIYNIHTFDILDFHPNAMISVPVSQNPENKDMNIYTNGMSIQSTVSKDGSYMTSYATAHIFVSADANNISMSSDHLLDTIWHTIKIEP